MTQISFAIRPVLRPDRQLHWQMTISAAFAGGSLTAALLNLGALFAFSIAHSALLRFASARKQGGLR